MWQRDNHPQRDKSWHLETRGTRIWVCLERTFDKRWMTIFTNTGCEGTGRKDSKKPCLENPRKTPGKFYRQQVCRLVTKSLSARLFEHFVGICGLKANSQGMIHCPFLTSQVETPCRKQFKCGKFHPRVAVVTLLDQAPSWISCAVLELNWLNAQKQGHASSGPGICFN